MIGVLLRQKCSVCQTRRLWLIVRGSIRATICGVCDAPVQ